MLIDQTKIEKIYSGKSGCMCGCKGQYYDDQKRISRVLKNMLKFAADNNLDLIEDGDHIYVENEQRNYVIYIKECGEV